MRIMHVILSRGFAGSERYAAELASFQAAEHDVMLIVRRTHRSRFGTSVVDAVSDRVQVSPVPTWLRTQRAVEQRIREFRPDIIHTHLRRSGRIVARARADAPSVATLHNGANGPHFFLLDGLICNAHWQVRQIPATYRGQVFKLNQLFTPHRRVDAAEVAALRRSLGVGPEQYLIGSAARLAHSKGLDTLIEAFRAADLPTPGSLSLAKAANVAGWSDCSVRTWPCPVSVETSRTTTRHSTCSSAHRAANHCRWSCWRPSTQVFRSSPRLPTAAGS